MIVLKFGGTSVKSQERIDNVLNIAEKQLNKAPVLISSAMATVTDQLVSVADNSEKRNKEAVEKSIKYLRNLHVNTIDGFLTGKNYNEALEKIETLLGEFESLSKGLLLLRECTPRSLDALLSFGELLSTTIIYHRAIERGINAEFQDSRNFMITDNNFNEAAPDFDEINKLVNEYVKPEKNKIIIAQGFIARTKKGVTATLGRGGSDYSATIIGSALNAEEVQIWTDVNGIMTTDPRIISSAKTIPSISYEEAAELAYFGAKVVHPSTIQPAVEKSIPVIVKNTMDPDGADTSIIAKVKAQGLRAISAKKNITLINISSSRMLNAYGFLNKIFTIFEKYSTSVDLIATSEVSVSMTIENTKQIKKIIADLEKIGKVNVEEAKSILCLVGKNIWKESSFVRRVFDTLDDIPIRMISLGSSDTNLSLVVPQDSVELAIKNIHKEFFG